MERRGGGVLNFFSNHGLTWAVYRLKKLIRCTIRNSRGQTETMDKSNTSRRKQYILCCLITRGGGGGRLF